MSRPTPYYVQGYHLGDPIGEGTAGRVYSARPVHPYKSDPPTAIKVIPRAKVRTAVRREVALHIQLRHPNIVPLHRVLPATPSSSSAPVHAAHPAALALVMDRARAGDMFTEVANAGGLSPRVLRRRLRDVTAALSYLHHNAIVHLDLKLENIVIGDANVAQLIDFGCARRLGDVDPHSVTTRGGTLHYMSPEVVSDPATVPSEASDAWALGVVAFTAIAGYYPFNAALNGVSDEENDRATRRRIVHSRPHRLPEASDVPSDLRRIISGLLEKDPQKRMTIAAVVEELSRSIDVSIVDASRVPIEPDQTDNGRCVGHPGKRPRSPSTPAQADFGPSTCQTGQTRAEALEVVDSMQRSIARAAGQVSKYMGDFYTRVYRDGSVPHGSRKSRDESMHVQGPMPSKRL